MEAHFELNEVTRKLPKHLHKFIVRQPYEEYTPQNQAVWRYVMRMNVDYLCKVAHGSYIDGLAMTVLPEINAATIWPVKMANGKFHGLMQTNMPRACNCKIFFSPVGPGSLFSCLKSNAACSI